MRLIDRWFLYLNDDVMFGQEVWPHDFFTPDGGQKVKRTCVYCYYCLLLLLLLLLLL